MSSSTERVRAALAEAGLSVQIVETERSARTAAEAAEAVGAQVGQIVKSLVFLCDGIAVMALVSGANRLDERKLAGAAEGRITRADADAVRAATGFAIGGVAPLGSTQPIRVFCDRDLLGFDVVWAAAGTPSTVFAVPPAELARAAGAMTADLARRDVLD